MNINVLLILHIFMFHSNMDILSLDTTGIGVHEVCRREVSFNHSELYRIVNILETVLKLIGTKRLVVVFDEDYRFLGKYTIFSNLREVWKTTTPSPASPVDPTKLNIGYIFAEQLSFGLNQSETMQS